MNKISDNMQGALLMMTSMTGFTINDAFMKSLADEIPLMQALFVRGIGTIIAMIVICAVLGQLRPKQSKRDWLLIILRTIGEVGGAYFFLTALFNMPLANVSAILQALPLTVSLAGAIFLGEALGWRRLLAIAIGFGGVMLIVRPGGADFNSYSVYALLAVGMITLRDLCARRLSHDVPSLFVALIAAVGVTGFAGLMSLSVEWAPFSTKSSLQLLGSMSFVIIGYIASVMAMRVGEISFIAPFRYTSLLVAIILGLLVFGEVPILLTILGATIVVVTGLFTLYRENKIRQATQASA